MSATSLQPNNTQGLSNKEVLQRRQHYGSNIISTARDYRFLRITLDIIREPMFILLVIACSLYFILGSYSEGFMMASAMVLVVAISFYQEIRSSRAIKSLGELIEAKITVVRDGMEQTIRSIELVPGDIILLAEGMNIPADAMVLDQNDLSVNESLVTGESLPVEKNVSQGHNMLYQGAMIESGKCRAEVTATGRETVLGKIGKAISENRMPRTSLQTQTGKFIKKFALFGILGLVAVFTVNYFHYHDFTGSLLFALTLAMSAVPEEIPVAFSSFMALGAYKLSKSGIISRQPQVIENIGAITVICLDKTGTITENKMKVQLVYDYRQDVIINAAEQINDQFKKGNLLRYAALASETDPFDPMEKAIWEMYYLHCGSDKQQQMKMIHEYALEGKPPMMTHVYDSGMNKIAAAKGASERILSVCKIPDEQKNKINSIVKEFGSKGYRVLGVASALYDKPEFPSAQNDFEWYFEGLLALYDPPKQNVVSVLQKFAGAGITVKLITGDHPETALTIAAQVGIPQSSSFYTGEDISTMDQTELAKAVKTVNVFARMFPDAKLKVIKALKSDGEVVAMTGDGINDGPALKAADIGIAMGKKGTEIAKQASDLVLTDDNLGQIVVAIHEGRKIFNNLLKAIRYIISIHIPIILTASLPLLMGWRFPNIFTPVHVIFLEIIMGPTCSIFFEREPAEDNIMLLKPRNHQACLFKTSEWMLSVAQGLFISAGVLALYYIFMTTDHTIEETRAVVFTTLILCNVFLTLVNRSFTKTILSTVHNKNNLAPIVIIVSVVFLYLLQFNKDTQTLFHLVALSGAVFGKCFVTALICVGWFEVYKGIRYREISKQ